MTDALNICDGMPKSLMDTSPRALAAPGSAEDARSDAQTVPELQQPDAWVVAARCPAGVSAIVGVQPARHWAATMQAVIVPIQADAGHDKS